MLRKPKRLSWLSWIRDRWGIIKRRREPDSIDQVGTLVPRFRSASEVFTPASPVAGRKALIGRGLEVKRIVQAICDERTHVVLYAERGRGKTSLSNLAIEALRDRGAIISRYACEPDTSFSDLIRGLMRNLPKLLLHDRKRPLSEGCEAGLPDRELRSADVASLLDNLTCNLLVFVVDEVDRIVDQQTRTRLADAIKILSDRHIRIHFMIIGVAHSLEGIMGDHSSIQRNIMAIHLPLLTDEEISLMLVIGGREANLRFPDEAKDLVCFVARGMPYMAQLLGLRIAQITLQRGGGTVTRGDLKAAVERLLEETHAGVLSTYAGLYQSFDEMPVILRGVANCEQDPQGHLWVSMSGTEAVVGGCQIPYKAWSLLIASGVLSQPQGRTDLALINNRPLIYHVQLLMARDDF